MDPLKVKEVDVQLKIAKNVLRHLCVKPPKNYQVVKYSELFETWLKERENVDEKKTRERQAKLEETVARKAKRQVKLSDEKKKETKPAVAMNEEALTQKLDKLISDDSLEI
jgi:ribosomal protein S6